MCVRDFWEQSIGVAVDCSMNKGALADSAPTAGLFVPLGGIRIRHIPEMT
jgi:hypothetical protein